MRDNSKSEIVKSVDLVKAGYSLSVFENKLLAYLLVRIKFKAAEFEPVVVNIQDFLKTINSTTNSSAWFDDALSKFASRIISVSHYAPDGQLIRRDECPWISRLTWIPKSGTITVKINSELSGFFLGIEDRFVMYDIKNILQMKCSYSVQYYDLFKHYLNLEKAFNDPTKGHLTMTIPEIRRKLDIDDKSYCRFFDFKKYTLDIPIKEINEHTDIRVTYELIYQSRNVECVDFKFHKFDSQMTLEDHTNCLSLEDNS